MSENKSSFFSLSVPLGSMPQDVELDKIENNVDLVFTKMKVKSNWYKYLHSEGNEVVYFFRADARSRKGRLIKDCELIWAKSPQDYYVQSYTKDQYETALSRIENNPNFQLKHKPIVFSEYNADDIAIFNNKKNWYPWQEEIYSKIFEKDGQFKEPHPRHIISLVDKVGNSGKSSFFKWIYHHYPQSIGRIGYGSASQLRSSAVNLGKKELYILDLARSKSKDDRQEDLLSVLEDLKSGLVTSSMYGQGKTLMMEPPHIIISSNYRFDYNLLSGDRWEVYQITPKQSLKTVSIKSSVSKK